MASAGAIAGAGLNDDLRPVAQSSGRLAPVGRVAAVSSAHARSGSGPGPCAAASAATIAGVDTAAARKIYAGEIHSNAVSADVAHVTGSRALLGALASSNTRAVYAAVHTIVYTPHWHIVRLRVVKAGRVLADVGGPYVIAPVSGALKWKGRTVGSYVMSVQDDVGYVKLVSRFIGVPVDLYQNGSFLMGTLQPAPSSVRKGSAVTVAGNAYQADVFDALAFPTGSLRVALLVPAPTSTVTAERCAAVRVGAWGRIAKHIAARLVPLAAHYQDLVDILRGTTGGLAFVRSGSARLAGAGPAWIPHGAIVRYAGRSWSVFAWEPFPPARIYLLIPSA